jgi:hypothetical protein
VEGYKSRASDPPRIREIVTTFCSKFEANRTVPSTNAKIAAKTAVETRSDAKLERRDEDISERMMRRSGYVNQVAVVPRGRATHRRSGCCSKYFARIAAKRADPA